MDEAKRFYLSKTIWANAIAVFLALLFGMLMGYKPAMEISVLGIVNVVLRFATKQPIK